MIILDRPRPTAFALHHISPPFVRIPWRTASPGGALRALCASPCRGARGAGRQKCGEFAADFTYKVVGMDDVDPLNPPPPARNHPPRPSARRPRTRLRWGKWSVRDDSVPNRILYLPSLCDEKIGRFGSTSGLCPLYTCCTVRTCLIRTLLASARRQLTTVSSCGRATSRGGGTDQHGPELQTHGAENHAYPPRAPVLWSTSSIVCGARWRVPWAARRSGGGHPRIYGRFGLRGSCLWCNAAPHVAQTRVR